VADFVLEHVDDATSFFSELRRVLKPGGFFCARTTNRLGYVGLAASLVPNKRHAAVLGTVQRGRKEVDVFPTRYRVNTIWRLRSELKKIGFEAVVQGYEAEPSYLQFSPIAYGFGKLLHSVTPSPLRTCLFIFGRQGEDYKGPKTGP
jgi:SAM-dependent methyltransferase